MGEMTDPNTGVNWITIQRRTVKHKRLPRKLKKMLKKWKWVESEPIGFFMDGARDTFEKERSKIDLSKPFI